MSRLEDVSVSAVALSFSRSAFLLYFSVLPALSTCPPLQLVALSCWRLRNIYILEMTRFKQVSSLPVQFIFKLLKLVQSFGLEDCLKGLHSFSSRNFPLQVIWNRERHVKITCTSLIAMATIISQCTEHEGNVSRYRATWREHPLSIAMFKAKILVVGPCEVR